MITAKIGRRGQLTLPSEIRKRLGVAEGQRIGFVLQNGNVTIVPLSKTLLDFRGAVHADEPQDFDEVRKVVRDRHSRHHAERDADG